MMKPKLSILCITYNHKKFIHQALDGFIMQKTNFPFEVLIHDDASTDGTADIIREYSAKYPDIIKPIFQKENQFSKGHYVDKDFNWKRIQGKYVALCEGDDYWTDENKLQKQVDFLEAHPDISVCFHPVKVIWEDKSQQDSIFPTPKFRYNKNILTIHDLLKHNFIQTNSVVYRWGLKGKEETFPSNILPCDWFLHLLHAQQGKIGFLPDIMGVYRRHSGGIWTGSGTTDDWFLRCAIPHLTFYKMIEKYFNKNTNLNLFDIANKAILVFLKHHNWHKLEELSLNFPEVYKQFVEQEKDAMSFKKCYKKYKKYKKINIILITLLFLLVAIVIGTKLI